MALNEEPIQGNLNSKLDGAIDAILFYSAYAESIKYELFYLMGLYI